MSNELKESMSMEEASSVISGLRTKVENVVFGQEELIEDSLCCLLSGGHILMTGAPGLAKTTLVKVFSQNLGLDFGRVQFTPDLLPSDIVGSEILNVDVESGRRNFEFSKGPVFTNLLLADEINRASPRTQSALLEAMQEKSCTINGKLYQLGKPFMVFATQNPFESEGTFPLPEAQLDRFLIHALVDYPDKESELRILSEHAINKLVGEVNDTSQSEESISSVQMNALIERSQMMPIDEEILKGMNDLVRSTRPEDGSCPDEFKNMIWYGAGPRAGISLISACRSLALIKGDERVRWKHVQRLAKSVLRHRIRLSAQARRDQLTEDSVVENLLHRVEQQNQNLAKGIS